MTKTECYEITKVIMDELRRAVTAGERVYLEDFGTFSTVTRAAKKGRNLRTGEPVDIPPKRVITFKVVPAIKKAM